MATVELKKTPTEPTDQDTDDVKYAKSLGSKALVGVATYPLTFAKTLFQLGYEPYPLSTGRVFIAFGREAYFLPNALKYIRNIYVEHGALALWRGAEAGFVGTLVGGTASYVFEKYIDEYYPEIGGKNDNVKKAEEELDDYESFQVHFRTAIRQTLTHTVGLIAQRPLTVLMVREIAQHIGGESKYPNFFTGILRVGEEEGPGGLFSGLIPALITDFILVWGVNTLSYAAERLLLHAERNNKDDKQAVDTIRNLRKVTNVLVPFVVSGWSYPFAVCSTVMSVTGSNLVVSLLPYAPLHGHWTDAYHYLKPHGLQRGARLFLREQKGAVSVGADHQLYASNKFFI
ncbi:unnamed protein product [Bursaphelenchus xylophilus]|uniref:(pine wood nematode) hypothetical protein n=1 Tax=Bursaphelenchus xylophilus TaxID=6326 RepID=A0A1I7S9C5_BURXY|nr:unnamed protein product [Bursaphelenchus xylophilus]CAG9100519.1 unnamed protein product [Bursaphelenchus xylophilus]